MMEELRRRFLPRFLDSGRARVRRAREACAGGPGALGIAVAELHALAGEASLLELKEIAVLARAGESAARGSFGSAAAACAAALSGIDAVLDALAEAPHPPAG